MPATAAIIGAIGGLGSTGIGIGQFIKGEQLKKQAKRPEMNIPQEIYNTLSAADIAALEGMSEQERTLAIENLQRNANFQMQEMGTRKAGLVGAAELGQVQNDAITNIAAQSEALRRQARQAQAAAQAQMADWKQQQFMANKMAPYMATVTAANAMQGAGLQNIMGGLNTAGQNASAAMIGANLPSDQAAQIEALKKKIKELGGKV